MTVPPQPSGTEPHTMPVHAWAGVFGVQHALAWHTSPVGHEFVHVIMPPQPSDTLPHRMPAQA
jgi:hypothetical protein